MIVPKPVIEQILNGTVTHARVPLDTFKLQEWTDENGQQQHGKPAGTTNLRGAKSRPEDHPPGRPAPAGKKLARILITDAQLVRLEETTDEQARAEGYSSVEELAAAFMATYAAAWTGADGWWLSFTIDRNAPVQRLRVPSDPGVGPNDVVPERDRAPEPESVDTTEITDKARKRWERDQQQREAIYRAMPLDQKLRLVQQDDRLRIAGRDDLRVIEQRLEAIWRRGKAA